MPALRIAIKLENRLPLRENVALAQYAEARGLDAVWIGEDARDAIVQMAAFALATERIAIGSAILPLYTRSATVLAMSAATLAELAPGRVVFGLGTSTPVIVERWHGHERRLPLAALEEHLAVIRLILGGERVAFAGRAVSVDGFRLAPGPVEADVPLYVAALGRPALALAGRVADGALLNAAPIGHVPAMRAAAHAAAAAAGRPPGSVAIAADVRAGLGGGARLQRLRAAQRAELAIFGKVEPYSRFFAEAGFVAQADAMTRAWSARDRDAAARAVDDELLDAIVSLGDRDAVLARLAAFAAAGLDELILSPVWDDEPGADAIRALIDVAAELREDGPERSCAPR